MNILKTEKTLRLIWHVTLFISKDLVFQFLKNNFKKKLIFFSSGNNCKFATNDGKFLVQHISAHFSSQPKSRRQRLHGTYNDVRFFCSFCKKNIEFKMASSLEKHLKIVDYLLFWTLRGKYGPKIVSNFGIDYDQGSIVQKCLKGVV